MKSNKHKHLHDKYRINDIDHAHRLSCEMRAPRARPTRLFLLRHVATARLPTEEAIWPSEVVHMGIERTQR